MGGCSSIDKNESDSRVMKKLRLVFSPHKSTAHNDFMIISSPIKDRPPINSDRPITPRSHNVNGSIGSKEDTFFDSKAWLDSDCDDDFVSVRGDFTPSRGNTPVHHNFSIGTTPISKSLFNESSPEPSPNTKKKRLSELFKDSLREDQSAAFEDHNNKNLVNAKVENKTNLSTTPSRASNNGDYRAQKEKTVKSSQCCLPMLSSRSFNERSKISS